jgi:hypothetical protein
VKYVDGHGAGIPGKNIGIYRKWHAWPKNMDEARGALAGCMLMMPDLNS